MAPGLDAFDVLLEVVLSLVRVSPCLKDTKSGASATVAGLRLYTRPLITASYPYPHDHHANKDSYLHDRNVTRQKCD